VRYGARDLLRDLDTDESKGFPLAAVEDQNNWAREALRSVRLTVN
jgi:hypothetical protein